MINNIYEMTIVDCIKRLEEIVREKKLLQLLQKANSRGLGIQGFVFMNTSKKKREYCFV